MTMMVRTRVSPSQGRKRRFGIKAGKVRLGSASSLLKNCKNDPACKIEEGALVEWERTRG